MDDTVLYLVHNVLAQHDLVGFRHRLTRQSSFRSAKQDVISQAIVNGLYEIDQENLFVVLEARCPETGNSSPKQLKSENKKKKGRERRARKTSILICASVFDGPPPEKKN